MLHALKYGYHHFWKLPVRYEGSFAQSCHGITRGSANVNPSSLDTEIRKFLYSKNVKAISGPTCFKCENLFPKAKTNVRSKKSDDFVLYINKTTGDFMCTDTGRHGSWQDLRHFVETTSFKAVSEIPEKFNRVSEDAAKVQEHWENAVPLGSISDLARDEALTKFGLDVLPVADLETYDLRLNKDLDSLIIPWFSNTNKAGSGKRATKGSPIGLKVISVSSSGKLQSVWYPAKNYHCMFGMSQVPVGGRIVLTMNEFDAIAINSASLRYKAASLPCGITHLPIDVLPYLEAFSEIILWFDNNPLSWEAARQFARKLCEKRCRLIRPNPAIPNALKAVAGNLDLDEIISSSVAAEIKHIVSFGDLRGFVKEELFNTESVSGVKWSRFPKLTAKLKGHRRGELTVLTGPTGSGKTTFMSEYSLDLAMHGVSTLWGSFEIQNVRLLKTMLKQFSRTKLESQPDNFEEAAEKFQMLPLHFMTYNGPQSIKDVVHTMRQAAYVHDIQHIVIDNLQFMMGAVAHNYDRFTVQDMLISEFRRFATSECIHVTIVIHPRKEDPGLPLQISSIFGTAKATQEADNVMILQHVSNVVDGKMQKRSYIEIVKNRYDGDLGRVPIRFDRNSLCMSSPPEIDALHEELKDALKVPNESEIRRNGGDATVEEIVTLPTWMKSVEKDA